MVVGAREGLLALSQQLTGNTIQATHREALQSPLLEYTIDQREKQSRSRCGVRGGLQSDDGQDLLVIVERKVFMAASISPR